VLVADPRASKFFAQTSGKFWRTYGEAFISIQEKVDELRHSEIENERLRMENAQLRLKLEELQFGHSVQEAEAKTKKIEYKLDRETGSAMGRSLASIAYRVPTQLVPSQVYTLGVSYFKAREDEKAAVIFTFLTGMDEDNEFKTPKNFLIAGVSWYRLENFAVANRYFDRVLKAPESPENQPVQAHARLWKALVATRLGKHGDSQHWLIELVDHHPHSHEAAWVNGGSVNRTEAHRGVASED
jgi:hypothetical protein